ncbi:hypothetical protein DdX_01333 [Ditylenchus destructor]|uniref:Uncharacterized protein n=1 Tax=Ditylenchus destructor TaxID=166010 RepID=A0AAD4NGR3_9BILA|nr:hypothetical protein DdX_01333 [Ditylenchus destructor]
MNSAIINLLREILPFFAHAELVYIFLLTSNRAYYYLIRAIFPRYQFSLDNLRYGEGQWTWTAHALGIKQNTPISLKNISRLASLKSVRFQRCAFLFNWGTAISMEFLRELSHFWSDRQLFISLDSYMPPIELGDIVFTSRDLYLSGKGTLKILQKVLPGNCEKIEIRDNAYELSQLPVKEIVNFLFSKSTVYRELIVHSSPDSPNFRDLTHAIKQTFLTSTAPSYFKLVLSIDHGPVSCESSFQVQNMETLQCFFLINGHTSVKAATIDMAEIV